jgi:hypothetical protein
MAVNFNDNKVSEWSRSTAADGKWLNTNTIGPLIRRTEKLRDAIEDVEQSVTGINSGLSSEIQNRESKDTEEKKARVEADTTLQNEVAGLSDQLGNTITLAAGTGISLEEVEGGQTLKISANYNDADNTSYGIFVGTSDIEYDAGGWTFTKTAGNLSLSSDNEKIVGLKENTIYNIEIEGYYNVKNQAIQDKIFTAYIEDSNHDTGSDGKKSYFSVDMTRTDGFVPITFSFSFIPTGVSNIDPTTQTYMYSIEKWTGASPQSNIQATLRITNISIFEVASKTITVKTPEITLYGLTGNSYLSDSATSQQKLFLDGSAMSSSQIIFEDSKTITLNTDALYNCTAIIEIEKQAGSTISDTNNAFTFTVPYASSLNMVMTYTIDLNNDLNTINLNWQASNCNKLSIWIDRLPDGLKARIKYIQFTEILK